MPAEILELLANPFLNLSHRILARLPSLAAAFVFLLLGLFVARLLRTIAERILDRTRLDEMAGKVGINEVLARLGLGRSPAYVLSFLIYWFVLLAFFVSAANAVNLTIVSELLERFMLFVPSVIAAIVVLFGGLIFGRLVSEVVANAATANNIRGGVALARASHAGVVFFSALLAAEQLGLQMLLISSSFQILLASVGLAAALAFGLGGKSVAEEMIREFLGRQPKA